MCSKRHGGGRVRSTTPAENRYIVLSTKRNRRSTASEVANQFLTATGNRIFRKTVARRLQQGGLYARRPVVCIPLSRRHRTVRLQWCHQHRNWREEDWACILFSDKSRFSLSSDCRRQRSGVSRVLHILRQTCRKETDILHVVSWYGLGS